jgi:hypothetical protein
MRTLATARLKKVRALQLAADGQSYDQIARAVGFTNRGSAHRAVFKALASIFRALTVERCSARCLVSGGFSAVGV